MDYSISHENLENWEVVQDYLTLGVDMASVRGEGEWSHYRSLQLERQSLGKIIINDWRFYEDYARQAGLTHESIAISAGLKARPLSLAEQNAVTLGAAYKEKAQEARGLWNNIRSTHPGAQSKLHPDYAKFDEARGVRNQVADEILKAPGGYLLVVRALGQGLGMKKEVLQKQADAHRGESPIRETKNGTAKDAIYQHKDRITSTQIRDELASRMGQLTQELLGKPHKQASREQTRLWRYGSKGSVAVTVSGVKQGRYANFETGVYGGGLEMIQDHFNLSSKGAYQWALSWLGHTGPTLLTQKPYQPLKLQTQSDEPVWKPVFPVPENSPEPNLKGKGLSYQLENFNRQEMQRFTYRNKQGQLIGYVVRLEDKEGQKVTLPLTYCENSKGRCVWRWQGFGKDRPLYGLDRLSAHPEKPVLIVEGEKAADAAHKMLPAYVVISWQGGAAAAKSSDWKPLIGKDITLWPDNDTAGHQAVETIQSILKELHQKHDKPVQIHSVKLPDDTPAKWDLADPLPEGWTQATIQQCLNPSRTKDYELTADEDVLTKITAVNKLYRLEAIASPNKETIIAFVRETISYLKTLGVDEEAALTQSCHMLSEVKRIKDITPLFIRYSQNHDDHALRVSVVAAQLWHEGLHDKQRKVKDPVIAAIALVKEHDKERASFVEKIHNRYIEHLSRDKIEAVCDHAMRHKEATGKALDDNKIHELACEIQRNENTHRATDVHQKTEANAQHKVLEIHHEQVRQLQETMKTLVLQQQLQQVHQRMLQQEKGRGLSL